MISEKTITELQEIIRQEYQKDITLAEAREIAEKMVGFYGVLARIHHQSKNEFAEGDKPKIEEVFPTKDKSLAV